MQTAKHHYIKYTRLELENYTKLKDSCVKKVNRTETIRFLPTILAHFNSSIQRVLSRKIGKYDVKLNGIVLDFRNTKILNSSTANLHDNACTAVKVETNYYVFAPIKGVTVTGIVKYVKQVGTETLISVVIYRVFNVKITLKGRVKQEVERNQEIKVRVTDFHFENVIPFIEGKP